MMDVQIVDSDYRLTAAPGERIVSHYAGDRGLVTDAEGREISHTLEANLSTGQVLRFHVDSRGRVELTSDRKEAVRLVATYPSPLTFTRSQRT